MPEGVSRTQIALYVAAALAVALLGARYLRGGAGGPVGGAGGGGGGTGGAAGAPPVRVSHAPAVAPLVHVAGAVRRPGVYRLRAGSRVDDAVHRAGGATRRADLAVINLAAKVEDGRQVLVPVKATAVAAGGGGGGSSGASAGGAASAAGAAPGPPVNLNTATLEQLDALPGVGPSTAQKILDFRTEHGGFGSVDDLRQVPGIGDKRLASLKDLVTA